MSAAVEWSRRVLVVGGVAAMGWWAWLALTSVPPHWWPAWGIWLAGSVALHDAVLAPLVVVLGWLVLVRLPALAGPRSGARADAKAQPGAKAQSDAAAPADAGRRVRLNVVLRGSVMVLGPLLLVALTALWSRSP